MHLENGLNIEQIEEIIKERREKISCTIYLNLIEFSIQLENHFLPKRDYLESGLESKTRL